MAGQLLLEHQGVGPLLHDRDKDSVPGEQQGLVERPYRLLVLEVSRRGWRPWRTGPEEEARRKGEPKPRRGRARHVLSQGPQVRPGEDTARCRDYGGEPDGEVSFWGVGHGLELWRRYRPVFYHLPVEGRPLGRKGRSPGRLSGSEPRENRRSFIKPKLKA